MKKTILLIMCLILVFLSGCQAEFIELDTSHQEDSASESSETQIPTEIQFAPIPQDNLLATYTDPDTGKDMDYHLYIPKNATENMPLIIYLHGMGAVSVDHHHEDNPMYVKAFEVYGEEFPFLILVPSSMHNKTWISQQMPQRVKSLIDYVVGEYRVNPDKIIITGHSMGASGVFRQIELYGDFYSAAIPVSVPDVTIIEQEKCLDIPIWGFAGSKEGPWNTQMQEMLKSIAALGGNTKYTEIEGADHGQAQYRAFLWDVLEWAIAQ